MGSALWALLTSSYRIDVLSWLTRSVDHMGLVELCTGFTSVYWLRRNFCMARML